MDAREGLAEFTVYFMARAMLHGALYEPTRGGNGGKRKLGCGGVRRGGGATGREHLRDRVHT